MLRYGIPNYRFPKDRLDEDINAILTAGDIEIRYNTHIDTAEKIRERKRERVRGGKDDVANVEVKKKAVKEIWRK